jgi:hypothetical protein
MMRLRNSIVLYKDDPVYIREIVEGNGDDILRVLFDALPIGDVPAAKPKRKFPIGDNAAADLDRFFAEADAERQRKFISSKHFDIGPFKLGYVNHKNGAFYATRLPNRIQKQGLCQENFSARDNFNQGIPFGTYLANPLTPDAIKGKYPSFGDALRSLDKIKAVAFSREFCLVRDECVPALVWLYHKAEKVGMYTDNKATLGPKFNCLKESLQEMQIKVGAF